MNEPTTPPPAEPVVADVGDTSNEWWTKNIDRDLSNAIVVFNLVLNGKTVQRDWRGDADINYETLEDDLETMPSIFAFWSAVLSEARKRLRTIEFQITMKRARILDQIGKDMKAGMKLTKDDKDNIVTLDKGYQILVIKQIDMEGTVSKLFGIVDSLKMKADNLRSLAGFKRAELQGS